VEQQKAEDYVYLKAQNEMFMGFVEELKNQTKKQMDEAVLNRLVREHYDTMRFNLITDLINQGVDLDLNNEKFCFGEK